MGDLTVFVKRDALSGDKKKALDEIQNRAGLQKYAEAKAVQDTDIKEMILLFDATGSMSGIWNQACQGLDKLVGRVSALIPGIKISLTAYRDYCDKNDLGILESLQPTTDIDAMRKFINRVKCDGGGDNPEAVELALEQALGRQKSFVVLVGDAPPHGVEDDIVEKDYKKIVGSLAQQEIKVYTVMAGHHSTTKEAFEEIAEKTNAEFFRLEQIDALIDVISAATAKSVNKVSALAALVKKEQGGVLTESQKKLFLE